MTPHRKLITALAVVLCGCAGEAGRQAGEGAKYGAVGGAVAGAVSAAIFGGNIAQGAAAGAVTGAASGAAVGAVAGSAADKQKAAAAPPPAAKTASLRERIGDRNYASALLIAQCQHKEAIASAEETFAGTQDRDQRVYALFIQGVAAEESGDKTLAASVYPRIEKEDPARGNADKLRADALQAVIRVQAARRQNGLPPTCS
ncbi:MAG TPA: hypothetical protein VL199_08015 [Burkholderiales bacterium]|jgi:hypothetical protein|nr:hypothetical protein [Burkholderiales bacterium]